MTHSRRQFLEISLLSGGGLLASFALPDLRARPRTSAPPSPHPARRLRAHPRRQQHRHRRARLRDRAGRASPRCPCSSPKSSRCAGTRCRCEQLPLRHHGGQRAGQVRRRVTARRARAAAPAFPMAGQELREAGAQIRQLLVAAAAQLWKADAAKLKARDAMVSHPDGRTATYGCARGARGAAAAAGRAVRAQEAGGLPHHRQADEDRRLRGHRQRPRALRHRCADARACCSR